jgi:hypothetical protein
MIAPIPISAFAIHAGLTTATRIASNNQSGPLCWGTRTAVLRSSLNSTSVPSESAIVFVAAIAYLPNSAECAGRDAGSSIAAVHGCKISIGLDLRQGSA